MKVGAERSKVALLAVLLAAAGGIFYYQLATDPSAAAPPTRSTPPPAVKQTRSAAEQLMEGPGSGRFRTAPQRSAVEFKPTLKRTKPGETLDPAGVDPTLRVDLLAKVHAVPYEGVERNLFQFGAAKPKPAPSSHSAAAKPAPPAAPAKPSAGGEPPAPGKPAPPPITMKYFGFANRPGEVRRRAFFLDGDEIYVAAEGDVIQRRYKVVRIGVNSVVVEDLEHQSQQTLPLQEG